MITTEGSHRVRTISRWTARILGALLVGLFLTFFVGETLSSAEGLAGPRLTPEEAVEMAAVALFAIGVVVGWRWETPGGVLCVAGGVAFIAVESLGEGALSLLWFPWAFVLVGALYLLSARLAPSPAPRSP